MCRMNTFGYADMRAFATAIQKRGVGALELNATGMKAAGAYVCRSLSYEGAEFKLLLWQNAHLRTRENAHRMDGCTPTRVG